MFGDVHALLFWDSTQKNEEERAEDLYLGEWNLDFSERFGPNCGVQRVNSYAVDIIKWRMHDGLLQERMKEKNKSHASYKRVYIANWVIIYHLQPIKGSGNSCWFEGLESQLPVVPSGMTFPK